ncbi:ABC transporter transmembrane domain-containing protein, partial [Paenibacillus etheri]|uniref:ABC transporter transmembrane domain-containing protein n=1 Tax=Paenibacillus etheri TaxID=1306852 RepID=UPI001ADF004D
MILVSILFSHILIQLLQGNLQILIATKIEIGLKKKVFRSILDLRMKPFEQIEKGKLINHIESDIQTFSNMFTDKISIFVDFISIFFVSILMFRIDLQLTLILFLTFPITSLVF